jgi:hypothetical protein
MRRAAGITGARYPIKIHAVDSTKDEGGAPCSLWNDRKPKNGSEIYPYWMRGIEISVNEIATPNQAATRVAPYANNPTNSFRQT